MADTKINTVKKVGKIVLMQRENSADRNSFVKCWKNGIEIPYTKYTIKETDMRIKTATFTSPDYIDLTTGQYLVRISSQYHENFAGVILDVDYDPSDGLYNYQCQDWSRTYIEKGPVISIKAGRIYDLLMFLLTRKQIIHAKAGGKRKLGRYTKLQKNAFKTTLSGLHPLGEYDQSLYDGNKYKGNPFKTVPNLVIRDKTYIEIIRDLVFSQLGFFDVWFNDRGILQIEPISKKDWETTGLHLTTPNALKQKYKFSTTNVITKVVVNSSGTETGKGFNIGDVKSGASSINLASFFGWIGTSISDPTQKTTTTSASKSTSNATKTNAKTSTGTTKDNPYGTKKKEVWLNSDSIYGQSTDLKFMQDIAKHLNKAGWTTHIFTRAYSESHYQHRPGYAWGGKVKNGIWFTIYGGACAGTLRESANTSYYRKPLVDAGSRTVIGFRHPPAGDIRKGGKYYSYLPRAHDDGFSGGDPYIRYPAKYLTDHAMPFMYAKDAKQMAEKFLQGGDNPEACTKNWKFYNKGGFLSGGR